MADSPVLFPRNAAPGYIADIARPSSAFLAARSGADLIVQKSAPLPEVCVKCGKRDRLTRKQTRFAWTPPWIYATALLSVLIMAILAAVLQKRGALSLPLCPECRSRWTKARLAGVATAFGFFGILIGMIALFVNEMPILGCLSIAALIGLPLGVSFGYIRPRTLRPRVINDQALTLIGVHPDAIDAILQAAGEGGARSDTGVSAGSITQ